MGHDEVVTPDIMVADDEFTGHAIVSGGLSDGLEAVTDVMDVTKDLASGKNITHDSVQSKAGSAAKNAGLACVAMAGAATAATAGAAAPVAVAACGAVALGGHIVVHQKDDSPSNQDVLDAVQGGFDKLDRALENTGRKIEELVTQKTDAIIKEVEQLHTDYSCDEVQDVLTMIDKIDNDYLLYVYDQHMPEADLSTQQQLRNYASDFSDMNFGRFLDRLKGCSSGPSLMPVVMQRIPAFLSARTKLFAMESMYCSLKSKTVATAKRCTPIQTERLATELQNDMLGFQQQIDDRCIINVASITNLANFPVGCFGDRSFIELDEANTKHVSGDLRYLPQVATRVTLASDLITGDLANLPHGLTYLDLHSNTKVTGSLAHLPPRLAHLDLNRNGKVTGTFVDLPRTLTHLDLNHNGQVSGSLADLPQGLTHCDLNHNEKATGTLENLPQALTYLDLNRNGKVTGSLADLPQVLAHLDLNDNKQITGSLSDLPRALTYFDLHSNDEVTGSLADLPQDLTYFDMNHNRKVTGTFTDLPSGLTHLDLKNNWEVSGSLANLPQALTRLLLYSTEKVHGGLADLPLGLTYLVLNHGENFDYRAIADMSQMHIDATFSETVTGRLADLPQGLTHLDLQCSGEITGKFEDLPKGLTYCFLGYKENVDGNLADLPRGLTYFHISNGNRVPITGDLSDLPRGLTYLSFEVPNVNVLGSLADLPRSLTVLEMGRSFEVTGSIADLPEGLTRCNLAFSPKVIGSRSDVPEKMHKKLCHASLFDTCFGNNFVMSEFPWEKKETSFWPWR